MAEGFRYSQAPLKDAKVQDTEINVEILNSGRGF